MRKLYLFLFAILSFTISQAQYTVISDDSAYVPSSANALLEVYSQNGNKGILVPRLTTAQRTAITTTTPADNSLLVYDTDTKTFWYFDGTAWVEIIPGGTDNQQLTLSNDTLYIENGNWIYLGNYNQTLTFDDVTNTLTISNGNSVIIPDSVNDADSDPTNEIELPPTAVSGQVLTWDGTNWIAQNPGSGADNWGSQVVVSDATLTGDGTTGNPLAVNGDLTDDQQLSLTGNTLSLTDGGTVDLSTYLDNTDDQNLTGATLTGTTLQIDIENGSSTSVDLSSLQDGTGTDNQQLSLSGNTLLLTNSTSVDLSGFLDNTDNQTLSLSGTTLSISGGNSVDLNASLGNDWKLTGNAGTTAGTNFLGTTDAIDLVFKTNATEWMRILSGGNVGIGTTTPGFKLDVVGNLRASSGSFSGTIANNWEGGVTGRYSGSTVVGNVAAGVLGQQGSLTYPNGWSPIAGVIGLGDNMGVYGYSLNNQGVYGESDYDNGGYFQNNFGGYALYAYSASGGTNGVLGVYNGNTAIYFRACADAGNTGYETNGLKSAVVPTSKGPTLLYCVEGTEVWFMDMGKGKLHNGKAYIKLDPVFMETVTINKNTPMQVSVTPTAMCNGLIVIEHQDGFEVIETLKGSSNATFNYTVYGKRKYYEDKRLDVEKGLKSDPRMYDATMHPKIAETWRKEKK